MRTVLLEEVGLSTVGFLLVDQPGGDAPPAVAFLGAKRHLSVDEERSEGCDGTSEAVDRSMAPGLVANRVETETGTEADPPP